MNNTILKQKNLTINESDHHLFKKQLKDIDIEKDVEKEVEENLNSYITTVLGVYNDIKNNPKLYSEFKELLKQKSLTIDQN